MALTIGSNLNSPSPPENTRANRSGSNTPSQRTLTGQEATERTQDGDESRRDAVAVTASPAPTEASGNQMQGAANAAEAANRAKQLMAQDPNLAILAQANVSPQAALALLQRA